eukprot:1526799-Pleurochrysis_carterae.AAC.1
MTVDFDLPPGETLFWLSHKASKRSTLVFRGPPVSSVRQLQHLCQLWEPASDFSGDKCWFIHFVLSKSNFCLQKLVCCTAWENLPQQSLQHKKAHDIERSGMAEHAWPLACQNMKWFSHCP